MTKEEREEAIEILSRWRVDRDYAEEYLALETAIESLKAEPCEDCVSREVVMKLKSHKPEYGDMIYAFDVELLPSVTPARKKGKWTKEETIYGWDGKYYQCSACGRSIHLDTKAEDLRDYPYCHCGAEMENET